MGLIEARKGIKAGAATFVPIRSVNSQKLTKQPEWAQKKWATYKYLHINKYFFINKTARIFPKEDQKLLHNSTKNINETQNI